MYKHQSSAVSHWALLINTGMYTNNTEYTQIDVCSMNVIQYSGQALYSMQRC